MSFGGYFEDINTMYLIIQTVYVSLLLMLLLYLYILKSNAYLVLNSFLGFFGIKKALRIKNI